MRQIEWSTHLTGVFGATFLWYGGHVNAEGQMTAQNQPLWWRRLVIFLRRKPFVPILEGLSVLALIAAAVVTYLVAARQQQPQEPLTPWAVAILLVANLLPAMALMALLARRIAIRRAAASQLGGRGRLHVRLVALFSVVASVPTLLVVIFASFLFQSASSFWFSNRAHGMLDNAARIAQETYDQEVRRVGRETEFMAGDVAQNLNAWPVDDPRFIQALFQQVYVRNLSEAVIL